MAINKYLTLDDTGNKQQEVTAIVASPGTGQSAIPSLDPATGQLSPTIIPGGEDVALEASEDLSANDLVNIWDDAGTFKVRKADASSFATRAMGFVQAAYLTGAIAVVKGEGIVSGQVGLDPADDVFLSTTPGETSQSPATGTAEVWQTVGHPVSATQFAFEKGEAICRA